MANTNGRWAKALGERDYAIREGRIPETQENRKPAVWERERQSYCGGVRGFVLNEIGRRKFQREGPRHSFFFFHRTNLMYTIFNGVANVSFVYVTYIIYTVIWIFDFDKNRIEKKSFFFLLSFFFFFALRVFCNDHGCTRLYYIVRLIGRIVLKKKPTVALPYTRTTTPPL